ncbi:Holliday junction ATP-dependent DNA helicase RuvA [Thermaurantimonas aggregans]|uniref:Holliday junction branch migration complex subunit RuvA n=1 Tax=Thermaurantimonas aggregans TaxID=2173829 RepID=A0A401XL79_9FLAO|nr:Holliday junction branch migration protein RuvA [Thermaurantimonas aggregans]MCX8148170.1 Holliday junction branch migration protein RuvA [Thermaurantimonas aggregans]GCD77762.1 Holliday junction ATP-dependent DNA helicase RuvA [Thermaurantimonas aggregans]
MYYFLEGTVEYLQPTQCVLNVNGVGWQLQISVFTFEKLVVGQKFRLFTHLIVREDAHVLYGFLSESEREIFQQLISVSGVGANTARLILSHLRVDELVEVIASGNVNRLKAVKGIGAKTAERLIIDLRDKVASITENYAVKSTTSNTKAAKDALSALEVLGYPRPVASKVVDKIVQENPFLDVESIIKLALKNL